VDDDQADALTSVELDRIEKAIFEVARQQRSKQIPVKLPFPDFWSLVVKLVIHLEQEVDQMRREGIGSARLSTATRRISNIRTQLRNLANLRLNALTNNAVIESLLEDRGKTGRKSGVTIDWSKMDAKERSFHSEISLSVERFRRLSSWNVLMGVEDSEDISVGEPSLSRFNDGEDQDGLAPLPSPSPKRSNDWDDPEIDEEDRIRAIDAGYIDSPPAPTPSETDVNLVRIRIIQDSEDPVIDEEGREISIVSGEVHLFSKRFSETLISVGLAELSEI